MKIAIISDSHGHTENLQQAVIIAKEANAEALLHCGDICSKSDVGLLSQLKIPTWLVEGNMDRRWPAIYKEAQKFNITFDFNSVEVPLGEGQYMVAVHGQKEHMLQEFVQGGQFPYVCHGHTHCAADYKFRNTRVICPGSLNHPRFPDFETMSILDTKTDTLNFYRISDKSDVTNQIITQTAIG